MSDKVIVDYKLPNLYNVTVPSTQKDIILIPGVNEVEHDDWAEISKIRGVKRDLELGTLEVMNFQREKPDSSLEFDSGDSTIARLSKAEDAIAVIRRTNDAETLRGWQKGERRKLVLTELKNRIDYIEKELRAREMAKTEKDIRKGDSDAPAPAHTPKGIS